MKRLAAKLICTTLTLCMLLTLAGCCCLPDTGMLEELTALTYVGTYTLYEVEVYGTTIKGSDIEEWTGLDPDECYIRLNADGTGEICNGVTTMDIEWDHEEIWPAYAYEDPVPFTVSGSKLTVDWNGTGMTFTKD